MSFKEFRDYTPDFKWRYNLACIYIFKVKTPTRAMCEICSKLTIKTSERRFLVPLFLALNRFHILFWCFYCWFWTSGVFIADFKQVNVDWQSIFLLKVVKGRPASLRLLTAYIKLKLTLNVPIPDKVKKIKLNFYFHTSLWCLKRFHEGLKGLHKTFWGTTKTCENKNLTHFFFSIQLSEMSGSLRIKKYEIKNH